MARTRTPRYLKQRYRRWYAELDIPKDVRQFFDGKARFVRSLQSESETVAERRVGPVISDWKRQIERARMAKGNPEVERQLMAEKWREDLAKAKGKERWTLEAVLESQIDVLKLPSDEEEQRFERIVRGETVRTDEKLDDWLSTLTGQKQKTLDMKRSDVARFAKRFPFNDAVCKRNIRLWIDDLQQKESLSPATVRRISSACRRYWKYLQHLQLVPDGNDPFEGVNPSKKKVASASAKTRREPFIPTQIVTLWKAAKSKGDNQLADLIWCAMWTGCRIEELCSLRLTDINQNSFQIREGKTNAGWREVPIHPTLSDTFDRLANESTDGFLLSALLQNKYGNRSDAIGKRFGRLKTAQGFGQQLVFHSIRKTVITLLERAGAPENVVADIVGHEKKTMTYGLYSGGASLENKREVIKHLAYPL